MLFGFGSRNRSARRGGLLGGNLRNAALAGAGMLAMRWWRNRRNNQSLRTARRHGDHHPVQGWQ